MPFVFSRDVRIFVSMDTVDTKYPVSARTPDWIQIFVNVDTGYRIGYKILLEWIPDTGLDTDFFQSRYRIPDWIHKIFQNIGSISKMKL